MQTASVAEIKKQLQLLSSKELIEFCLRLSKFKKENKELLTYLLFDAADEDNYIVEIKRDIDLQFDEINTANPYWVKKSLRKIGRQINRQIKYSGHPTTAFELLFYFCYKIKSSRMAYSESTALVNIYEGQIHKMKKIIDKMDSELQYDFTKQLQQLLH